MAKTFGVGLRTGLFHDRSRNAWRGTGHRPIRWCAWYPTSDGAAPVAAGLPEDAPVFSAGEFVRDAGLSAARRRFPVVLLSHGTGGSAVSLGWLAHGLAASGFVVIGVDHHGNTAAEPYLPEGFICWWERARDLTVALDALEVAEPFAGRLDMDAVHAAGFSLGGYTVLSLAGAVTDMNRFLAWAEASGQSPSPTEFPDLEGHVPKLMRDSAEFRISMDRHARSYRDARLRSVVALAPAPPVRAFTDESLAALDRPVTLAVGGIDRAAPLEICAAWLHARLPRSNLVNLGPDIGHAQLLSPGTPLGRRLQPDLFADPPGIDRGALQRRIMAMSVDAFRPAG